MNVVLHRLVTFARSVVPRLVPQVEALDHRLSHLEARWGETNHEVTVVHRTALRRLQDDNKAMATELLRLRAEIDQLHGEVATQRAAK
jgi:hypothetical protein